MSKNKKQIADFVLSKEQKVGGFGFAKISPPTGEDTYFAVKILNELQVPYKNSKTVSYVKNVEIQKNIHAKQLNHLVYLYKIFDLNEELKRVTESIVEFSENIDSLSELYYLLRLKENLDIRIDSNEKIGNILSSTIRKPPECMSDCEMRIFLMNNLKLHFNRQRYIGWIQKAQNGDGGFGFFPGSTSFLENVYYALKSLKQLHSKPLELDKCEYFVRGCTTNNGGFGRQISAVPKLEYTYYGIRCLKILDGMKKP